MVTVVALGALCALDEIDAAQGGAHFGVSEFAVLDDGTIITLHADRGFSTFPLHAGGARPTGRATAVAYVRSMTVDRLTADVLTTVLPDDAEDTGEDHDWPWLRRLLAERGIDTTVEDLRSLPYEVRFTDDTLAAISA